MIHFQFLASPMTIAGETVRNNDPKFCKKIDSVFCKKNGSGKFGSKLLIYPKRGFFSKN